MTTARKLTQPLMSSVVVFCATVLFQD